jgi:hypothetical protein
MYIKCAQEGCEKNKNILDLKQIIEILAYENDKKDILDRLIKKLALENKNSKFFLIFSKNSLIKFN